MQDSSTERVGRYQLLEPIGGGPNGSVSRAKVFGVAGFERQFAIKRFLPELAAAASSAQALSAAARSYGSLEHPRIARMSEFGVAQGKTFTAVELVAGLDVMRLVAESRLGGTGVPSGGALALISQAARAVGYAHGRGLSHLGLSPTNVIVTPEGDVKVTDFGILAATITAKPVETPRFAQRIGYLAPEQLVGEATSAATDVFVLGVIAYELVTGQRAFFGDTPRAIADAILAGPPADPPLPRPIVRVLARCLARSQFERFPDARAFADALDAALRVAPVPGTRKDIGAQVKATLDRHAAMNEGNLSGVVAMNLGGPASSDRNRPGATDVDSLAAAFARGKPGVTDLDLDLRDAPESVATTEFVRPDVEVAGPTPLVGPTTDNDPSSTVPDLRTTVPGAPPPIPSIPSLAAGAKKPPAVKPKLPSIVPQQIKPRSPTGAVPILRQTQPGAAPAPVAVVVDPPEVDDFGRPKRVLVGPIPGLGAPGRPPTDAPVRAGTDLNIRNETGLRAGSDSDSHDAETLPGDDVVSDLVAREKDFSPNDEATRPGEYARAESDFSELSVGDPAVTMPQGVFARPKAPLLRKDDDPPTAPHEVLPDVHRRGGLAPFAPQKSQFAEREFTGTSPSIEIIREPDSQELPALDNRDIPTSQMAPALVEDLQRASGDDADPLVELALEQHGRGAIEVLEGDQIEIPPVPSVAQQRKPTQQPPPSPNATMFGVGKAGSEAPRGAPPRTTPPRGAPPRMPSPSPPSLVTPDAANFPPPGPHGDFQPIPTPPGLAPPGTLPRPMAQSLAQPPQRMRSQPQFSLPSQAHRKPKSRLPIAIGALVVLGAGAGVAAWQIMKANDDAGPATTGSAGSASKVVTAGSNGSAHAGSNTVASGSNAVVASGSNAVVAAGSNTVVAAGSNTGSNVVAAGSNAGSNVVAAGSSTGSNTVAAGSNAAGSNAGSAASKPTIAPAASSDSLQIASTPPGARVFIDGADQGVTPVKLAGSADRHTVALASAGYDLYVAEVDGHGAFAIPLKAITPQNGPAGIKVIKCNDKNRYYVFVDGKPTGMTCPTERIGTTVGAHTVEVYDLVTESRRKWDITVSDTRLSYRVRVD